MSMGWTEVDEIAYWKMKFEGAQETLRNVVKLYESKVERQEKLLEDMSKDYNYSSAVMKEGLENVIELAQEKEDKVLEALAKNTLIRAGFLKYRE